MISVNVEAVDQVDGLWELPNGWKWIPLVCMVGGTERIDPGRHFPNDYFQYIDISSVDNQYGLIKDYREILGIKAPSRARKLLKKDDIIFATTRPYLRNIAIVPPHLNEAICSTGFCVIRANPTISLPKYLYYVCRSYLVINQLIPKQRGASYPAVTDNDVFDSLIPVPYPDQPSFSLNIQYRIVSRIESLLVELKGDRQLLDEMHRDTSRVMEATLTELIKELDKQYPISPTIDELLSSKHIKILGGGTPPTDNEEYWVGSIPWVSPRDMKRWHIDATQKYISQTALQERNLNLIPEGAVLIVVRGMILAHTLPVGITKNELTINQDMKALVPDESFLPEYLGYILRARAPSILQQVETAAHGTRRLKTDTLKKVTVPIISISAQRRIIEYLDFFQFSVHEMEKVMKQDSQLLEQLEQSILEKAFRGQL